MPRIHLVSNLAGVNALGDHLRAAGLGPTSARSADALLVLIDRPLDHVEQELLDRARQTVPVLLAGPTVRALPPDSPLLEACGLIPGRSTAPYELRLAPGPQGGPMSARMPDFRPRESWIIPDKIADDVERLLLVRHEMGDHPICTWRPSTGLGMFTLGAGPAVLGDPVYHRLIGRWLRHCLGVLDAAPARVGLLGTPDTTVVHHSAVDATEGLELAALCDGGAPRSLSHATGRAPRRVEDPDDLVNDPELGVIIVATPTHTHLEWAGRALEAGKHVVVHSPFCLSTPDTDQLAALAAARSLVLAVYPEGRDDPGYQGIRATLKRGEVGEPLWLEANQGGYRRPLGTWHDDERISGGQLHDRGGVLVDQLFDLLDEPVEWVSATTFTRVWHHVSNADHSRLLLHFANGTEAQIIVSDLAAAPQPRFDVLGTAGSLFLDSTAEDADLADAPRSGRHAGRRSEAVAGPLVLVTHDGRRSRIPLPVVPTGGFHRDLADTLVAGWPLTGYGVDVARRVVAVLEAAKRSAASDGAQIVPL